MKFVEQGESDNVGLTELGQILEPCLSRSLDMDGIHQIEDTVSIITTLIYFSPNNPTSVSNEMWSLFPQLLRAATGKEDDQKGGFGIKSLDKICKTIEIYVMKDKNGLLESNEKEEATRVQSILNFAKRCFEINRHAQSHAQGAPVVRVLLALLENMRKLIDNDMPQIITLILQELLIQ